MFVSDRDSASATWFVRDHLAMAKANGWGEVAPFYIEQEAPVPPGGVPHPAKLNVRLRNDHLQYAITWYSLAGVLVVIFAIWALRQRRDAAADRGAAPRH
jgi:cytochrome oxidase assembly protein ShyY1